MRSARYFFFTAMLATALGGVGHAADLRIGFVNLAILMRDAPQAQNAGNRLRNEFAGRKDRLDECGEELKSTTGKLRREGDRMSDSARERLNRTIIKRRRSCQRLQDEFQEDFGLRQKEELKSLRKLVYSVIQGLARDKGFDLIISEPVLYASDAVNLTQKVLDELERSAPSKRKP